MSNTHPLCIEKYRYHRYRPDWGGRAQRALWGFPPIIQKVLGILPRRFQYLSEHPLCISSEKNEVESCLGSKVMEVKLRSCSMHFWQKRRLRKKFLTLFDPLVTSKVRKINSTGLYMYLLHLEELFPKALKFFRSEL